MEGNIIAAVFYHQTTMLRGGSMWYGIFRQMILNLTWLVNKYKYRLNPTSEILQEKQELDNGLNLVCWVDGVLLDKQPVFLSPACQKMTETPGLEQITSLLPREFSEMRNNGNQYPIMM